MHRKASLLALPVAALGIAACGSSSKSSPATSAATSPPATQQQTAAAAPVKGNTVMVKMKGLAYVPAVIHAKVGQKVMWMNDDTPSHTVSYTSGPKFKSSGDIAPGKDYEITLTTPGTIHYFCQIHPFMHGTIIISK